MAARAPKPGDRYEYVGPPVGNDAGRFDTGTVMTVREFVDADTSGAFDSSADSLVLEWEEPTLGTDENGEPTVTYAGRAWSVSADEFGTVFKRAKE